MSQSDSNVFSVRIVSIDYYMSSPIPSLDISYSNFQGGKVNEVPVIRIYGSTPAGQKTCLHVHRALPYLYIPCSDLSIQPDKEGDACTRDLSLAIEKALKLKGNAGSKRQHVHGCSLVRAKKFYAYHSSEELFAKIYLYYPQDVSRAANLLLNGAVLDKILQPHESHIPFLLQFLVDYNLYGMGHLHVSKMKFRHPIPDVFSQRKANRQHTQQTDSSTCLDAGFQEDSGGDACPGSSIWLSSTIPDGWIWQLPSQLDPSIDQDTDHARRQSTCELEGDATVDEILNPQYILYSSLSQTGADVKMVQSLIPIWEEEFERTGMHGSAILSDPGKPLPEDVLRTLSHDSEFESKLMELCTDAENCPSCTPFENDISQSVRSSTNERNITDFLHAIPESNTREPVKFSKGSDDDDDGAKPGEGRGAYPNQLSTDELQIRDTPETLDSQTSDQEALRLLKWLASSQAEEDINSDDELVRETILSPLFPATTIDKMLEKANMDFESESQQECQDILDSVEDLSNFVGLKGNRSCQTSPSKKIIPQVDDSTDDPNLVPCAGQSSKIQMKRGSDKSLQDDDIGSAFTGKHKRKRSLTQNVNDALQPIGSNLSGRCSTETKTCSRVGNDADKGVVVGCSVRDLMRRKRCHRSEPPESEAPPQATGPNHLYGKLPLSSSSDDACVRSSSQGVDDVGVITGRSGSLREINKGNSKELPEFLNSENQYPADHIGNFKNLKSVYDTSKSGDDMKRVPEFSVKSFLGKEMMTIMQSDYWDGGGNNLCFKDTYISGSPVSMVRNMKANPSPIEENNEGKSVEDDETDECLEFFVADSLEGEEDQDVRSRSDDHQEFTGVPTHYQNDGSYLYMLRPVFSPPSADSVHKWLLHDAKDILKDNTDVASVETSSPKGSSANLVDSQSFQNEDSNEPSLKSGSVSGAKPIIMNHVNHQLQGRRDAEEQTLPNEVTTVLQSGENILKVKQATGFSQDISQISGPDRKSKLTPLSQIGFRDPAIDGGRQQLTLLSIEVQAESRGDLRPDPRFDAIKFIALVIQEDDDSIINAYVLLHSDTEPVQRNIDGITGCELLICSEEKQLFNHFMKIIRSFDPDILMGWDIQGGSLGFLAERAAYLGIGLLSNISRTPSSQSIVTSVDSDVPNKGLVNDEIIEDAIIEDEWGRTHASGIHVGGRIVLNVWRLMRGEVKLNMYTAEAVVEAVLRRKIPSINNRVLISWFSSGPGRARYRCIEYMLERAKLNLQLMNQLDMINRTSELARVFGIDFFSVLSRGSQYRVESMFLRLAHTQNYLAVSPGNQQVASQPAMECLPLVMEPESGFYADPVVVLDFQSLYPSMIIAYNLCFCTCLGKVKPSKPNTLGVCSYSLDPNIFRNLKHEILLTPNGVMYVPSKVRKGVLPRLLEEILSTRIMVKQAMKKLTPSQQVLTRIFNARQLALKLISNVTYGYTAAGYSGRMPCAELADSIVQCGRRTLENAISFVNAHDKWNARVIYGDTDSLFVLLKGRSVKESFQIGYEIASAVSAMNPSPVTLKMEKVYHPCFLLTKKRYVGYSYDSPDQFKPKFDAKGTETIRRDTCGAVSKTMEQSLKLFFEHQDINKVKSYLVRQWTRIISGRVSLQDFIFAKEVRLGTYSTTRGDSSLPPAAIVATKAMRADPRAEPRYAERIPYVVVHGEPGSRLVDMVVDPLQLMALDSPFRLNDLYYINKQIIPALQRVFGLVGMDLHQWFLEMPRPGREAVGKRHSSSSYGHSRSRIDHYYLSQHCILCGELVPGSAHLCGKCSNNGDTLATAVIGTTSNLERQIQHLAAICRHCGGGDWLVNSGVKCTSLACSVFYERRKTQKELQSLSAVASEAGFYPKCMVEWF